MRRTRLRQLGYACGMSNDSRRLTSDEPLTPCTGICRMDATGLCLGCRRTLAEIARWGTMSNDDRRHWIAEVQPSRPPARS
jgi:predicted Fe-S protein YdhL (DUF1289 family)